MLWAGIIDNELVGSWKVGGSVNMASSTHIECLKANLQIHLKQTAAFKWKSYFHAEQHSNLGYSCN